VSSMYVRVASRLTMAGLRIKSNPDNSFSWLPRLGNHGHLSLNLLSTSIYPILTIFPKKQILIFAMLVLRKKPSSVYRKDVLAENLQPHF